jgi:DNA topoisomerase I
VTDLLVEFFPDIVDLSFTAKMEDELDEIAEGNLGWVQVLDEFYGPFERLVEKNEEEIKRFEEQLDELCPRCPEEGREPGRLVVKLGRYGKFIGCDQYPECRYIRNLDGTERPEPELLDEPCPECGRPLARKVGRFGPFVGCSGYPECRYIKKEKVEGTGVTCPECKQGEIVPKRARGGRSFYSCDRYPDCTFAAGNAPVPDRPCLECGSVMLEQPNGGARCWNCGAVVDEQWNVVTSGDVEAEAAARAAKAEARSKRAAARAKRTPAAKKPAAKKPAAKKSAAKKSAARKATAKKSAAKKPAANVSTAEASSATTHAAEGPPSTAPESEPPAAEA